MFNYNVLITVILNNKKIYAIYYKNVQLSEKNKKRHEIRRFIVKEKSSKQNKNVKKNSKIKFFNRMNLTTEKFIRKSVVAQIKTTTQKLKKKIIIKQKKIVSIKKKVAVKKKQQIIT